MNIISGYQVIIALDDGDQLSASLLSTKPLSQYVKSGTSIVTPDWNEAANQPIIYVRAKSQLQGTRKSIVAGTENWSYNGTKMVFNASNISITPSGLFQKVTFDDGGVTVPGLRIISNLASISNTDNDRIEFNGKIQTGNVQTDIYPTIDVRLEETSGDPYDSYIDATEGGVIDDDTAQTVCTAYLLKAGAVVATGVVYKWHEANETGWTPINSDINKPNQKTITAADINSVKTLKCEFTIEDVMVCSAIRQLIDETDPLIISSNPSGPTMLKSGQSVTLFPRVIRRGTGTIESGYTFSYALYNNNDQLIKNVSGESLTITRTDVDAALGGLKVYITAKKQ